MDHVVMKHRRTTLERAEKFISDRYFKDVNLRGRLYPKSRPVTYLTHWAALPGKHTTYVEAVKQVYGSVKVGQQFGPTWATHWFHAVLELPAEWEGCEARLRWNSGSEALVWIDGEPRQGLCSEYDRLDFPLTECVEADQLSFSVYIEMACNGMFGAGDNGMIAPPDPNRQFTLSMCEVAVFDRDVYNLYRDIELLYDIAKHLPEGSERGYQALYTVNDVINACDLDIPGSFKTCHEIANRFLKQKNGDSQHTTYAMGHAHIDTAWLWPYNETKRKCARSWSCTVRLMEKYPEFTFTCSQAQQYEWVKQLYPTLFSQIKDFVAAGRFIPVGGTWVEMDGLIPSGESFIRQFLFGQRFFEEEFGFTCKEFWLPDTFGYSAQLPQIMQHCGISRFLTQKMSWSLINKFPHHTFWWEGIDHSKVLAHFPPGDSYEMKGNVDEVLRTVKNFQDKGRSDKTAFLFGYGDGGNGPSEDMIERLNRMKDIDGLPKVKMSTPDEFFSKVEEEDGDKLCRWSGELYLELHNGTYTTHARVKKMNRACEFMLHDVEFVSSVTGIVYPRQELARLWKLLLLNQFHDVLPGTSIGLVYKDAHLYYKDIMSSGKKLLSASVGSVTTAETSDDQSAEPNESHMIWNSQSWTRTEVVSVVSNEADADGSSPKKKMKSDSQQTDCQGNNLYCVTVPSYGYSMLTPMDVTNSVVADMVEGAGIVLQNEHLKVVVDGWGHVTHLYLVGSPQRNAMSADHPGNQFVLYDDVPLYWDAWDVMDYHLETRKPVLEVLSAPEIIESGPLRASVKFSLRISSKSTIEQTISLDVGCPYVKFHTQVAWEENRKFLKVEFPTSIHTREATYDIQFGHLKRSTHYNTSWDSARFEVCGHKWADLSEFGFGLAILNDCKYGYSAADNVLRLSLLRSPKAPDNTADMETHNFTYALMPHSGTFQDAGVIQQAYNLNSPLYIYSHSTTVSRKSRSFFSVGAPQVILETVKRAEDRDDQLILRLYESHGGHCDTYITSDVPFSAAYSCNGLEMDNDSMESQLKISGNRIDVSLRPFQILTLKLTL